MGPARDHARTLTPDTSHRYSPLMFRRPKSLSTKRLVDLHAFTWPARYEAAVYRACRDRNLPHPGDDIRARLTDAR